MATVSDQTKPSPTEKVYALPATMKEKFKKLADILRKKPNEACNALSKLFPEGLKMKWAVDKWEIMGMMAMDNKGGMNEIVIALK